MVIKDYDGQKVMCSITNTFNSDEECKMLLKKQGGTYSDDDVVCSEKNCPLFISERLNNAA